MLFRERCNKLFDIPVDLAICRSNAVILGAPRHPMTSVLPLNDAPGDSSALPAHSIDAKGVSPPFEPTNRIELGPPHLRRPAGKYMVYPQYSLAPKVQA